MALFILLSPRDAALVTGVSSTTPASVLLPVEFSGGVFVLGVEVLDDPAHARHHAFLASLPRLDRDDPAFPVELSGALNDD
jgi:hypothetical protein